MNIETQRQRAAKLHGWTIWKCGVGVIPKPIGCTFGGCYKDTRVCWVNSDNICRGDPRDYTPDTNLQQVDELLKKVQEIAYMVDYYWLKSSNLWNISIYIKTPGRCHSATANTWPAALLEAVSKIPTEGE